MAAVELLCKMLYEPTLSEHGPPTVLGALTNLFDLVTDTSILDSHMDIIKSHKTKAGVLVEKVVDWYAGCPHSRWLTM